MSFAKERIKKENPWSFFWYLVHAFTQDESSSDGLKPAAHFSTTQRFCAQETELTSTFAILVQSVPKPPIAHPPQFLTLVVASTLNRFFRNW